MRQSSVKEPFPQSRAVSAASGHEGNAQSLSDEPNGVLTGEDMRYQELLNSVTSLLARLSSEVELSNENGLLDINGLCEDILVSVFREVYDLPGLINLNSQSPNYPAIDLGDERKGIAFQVTSDGSSNKVKVTLQGFVSHKLYEQYPRLVIYILTSKKSKYTGSGWSDIIGGTFSFCDKRDILDSRDLVRDIRKLPLNRLARVGEILSDYLDGPTAVDVAALLGQHLEWQLQKEKNGKRYMPGVFMEIADIKDHARYFACPDLFLRKILDEMARLPIPEVNRLLRKLALPEIQIGELEAMLSAVDTTEFDDLLPRMRRALEGVIKELMPFAYAYRVSTEIDQARIAPEKRYIYRDMKFQLGAASSGVIGPSERLLSDLEFISSRVLVLVARAGRGKTNFVCDFAEHVLRKRDIPCVLLRGRDLSSEPPEAIGHYLARSVFGDGVQSEQALEILERYAIKHGSNVLVIIDGINEHNDTKRFSHHLEFFLEHALSFSHIRFLLTCRSEYFEQRFSNLKEASFSSLTQFVDDLDTLMSQLHRKGLLENYFRFYHISPPYLSKSAKKALEQDPLLLRMFCEVHGDSERDDMITLPPVVSIHRARLFSSYCHRKIEAATARTDKGSGVRLGHQNGLKLALECLTRMTIEQYPTGNIPVAALPPDQIESMEHLLSEDIIIRKDLLSTPSPFADSNEVVNFTFDEFRDYLIAEYIATRQLPDDPEKANETIDRLVGSETSLREGVGAYLFHASRVPEQPVLADMIKNKDWYPEVYVRSIFSEDDGDITPEDLAEVRRLFFSDRRFASFIIQMLVWRWDVSAYPTLNIRLLIDILSDLDERTYDSLVRPCVERRFSYRLTEPEPWTARELSERLGRALRDSDDKDIAQHADLWEILIFFFPIRDIEASGQSAAYNTFMAFAERQPSLARRLLNEHSRCAHESIRVMVHTALAQLSDGALL